MAPDSSGPVLPEVSVADLLRMIGDLYVTVTRQNAVISQQAERIAELEATESGPVAISAGGGRE